MAQHKWHKEIKAWADGAEVEMRWSDGEVHDEWRDVHNGFNWNSDLAEYRIKPPQHCCCDKQTCSALKEPQYLYAYKLMTNQGLKIQFWDSKVPYDDGKYIGKIKLEVED
jgi:hypothetical protein